MGVGELIELIHEVRDAYRTLESISPRHELLDYISLDERGVSTFPDVEASERFVERFGDGMSTFGWRGSLEEYGDKLNEVTFTKYRIALRKAIDEFVSSD